MQRTRLALAFGAVIAVLALAAAVVAPRLVDLQPVRAAIVAQLSQRLGADVTVGAVRLTFLPLPRLELTEVGLSIPNAIDGTIASVSIRPRVLPLLRGRVHLAQVRIEGADVKVTLPPADDGVHASSGVDLSEIQEAVGTALAAAAAAGAAIGPEAVLIVENGRAALAGASFPLSLHDVNARVRLPPGALEVHLTGASNLADQLTLEATLDAQRKSGSAQLDLARMRPQSMIAPLIPETWPRMENGELDLNVSVTIDGLASWNGNFRGSLPLLTLRADDQPLVVRSVDFRGSASVSEGFVRVDLGAFDVGAPRLNLSGGFTSDRNQSLVSLELDGGEIDVAAVRAAATTIAPNNPVVQSIFDILRGGSVSQIVLRAQAPSFDGLGDALAIEGTLADGRIHLPGIGIDLEAVAGRARVVGDVLEGEAVSARFGNCLTTAGSLRIGWGTAPSLAVSCGPSRIVLPELYAALRAGGWLHDAEDIPESVEGTVAAQSLDVSGPLNDPGAWRLALVGAVSNFNVDLPGEIVALRAPVSLTNVRLQHHGPADATSLSASFAASGGIQGTVDVGWDRRGLDIRRLQVRDHASDASISLLSKPQRLAITFVGHLAQSTVTTLLRKPDFIGSAVSGNFRADIPLDQPVRTKIQGHVRAENVLLPLSDDVHWMVEHVALDGAASPAGIEAVVRTATGRVDVKGTAQSSADGLQVDLDLTTDELDIATLDPLLEGGDGADGTSGPKSWLPPIRGTLRIAANGLTYREFTWRDVRATVPLGTDDPEVNITAATLCGIATPAWIRQRPQGLDIVLNASAMNQPLDPTLECLINDPGLTRGHYTFSADITMDGAVDALAGTAAGTVSFAAVDGRITGASVLARLFSALSLATGSLGNALRLTNRGLPYRRMTVTGNVRNGIVQLTQAVLDGPTVKIVGEGSVDIPGDRLALTLLVAPLVTADRIINCIPIIRHVFGGVTSIPVRVTGSLQNPSARPLDPALVSERLVGAMTRTIRLPFRLLNPLRTDAPR